jgi:sugar phosphate isomerase/epimerase
MRNEIMNTATGLWAPLGGFTFYYTRGEWDRAIEDFTGAGLQLMQLSGELLDEALEAPDQIPTLLARLAENGLSIAALGAYKNITARDPDKRRLNVDYVRACLEHALALGTPVVSTETGTLHPSGDWSDDPDNAAPAAWDALYEVIDELLPVAETSGAVLALEGYVNNILKTHDQVAQILERYPSPHLRVMCDPYNYLSKDLLPERARLADAFLTRFKDQLVIAHLKDVSTEGAEVDTPEFGTGIFPQGRYLRFLKEKRPDLPLIFEHLPVEHIPAAIRRVQVIQAAGFED